jgi:hypothetical protein
VCLHYLINRLQPLPFAQPVVVSLNPVRDIDPSRSWASYDYEHPVFDLAAIRAQQQVGLQGQQHTWFCGAWMGYGFHEDGLKSGLAVAHANCWPMPCRQRWRWPHDSKRPPLEPTSRAPDRLWPGAPHAAAPGGTPLPTPPTFSCCPCAAWPGTARSGTLAVNRRWRLSFHDATTATAAAPQQGGALAWLDELLRAEGITDATARSGCTATRVCWATPSSR